LKVIAMCFVRYALLPVLATLTLAACASPSTSGKSAVGMGTSSAVAGMSGLPDTFAGAWFVTAVFPTGAAHGNAGDRHIGTALLVKADEVSDVNGRRCATPAFTTSHVTAEIAGMKMAAPSDVDRVQVDCGGKPFETLLQLPGKALPNAASPIRGSAMLDGSTPVLIAQRPEGLYLLERAEQVLYRQANVMPALMLGRSDTAAPSAKPAAHVKAQPIANSAGHKSTLPLAQASKTPAAKSPVKLAAKPEAVTKNEPSAKSKLPAKSETLAKNATKTQPASSQSSLPKPSSSTKGMTALVASDVSGAKRPAAMSIKPTTTAPKPGAAIHLASYTGIGAAVHGWETLRGRYSELTPLKPLYVSTDIAGKGPTIRLFASGAAPEKLRQICSDLQSKQAYCALNP
jgi:hypothetical protein